MRFRVRYVVAAAVALTGCAALIDLRDDYVLGTGDGGNLTDASVDGELPVNCTNDTLDDTESDIDCGGNCPKCADGKKCQIPADCQSSVCTGGICQPPRCDDGVKNGTESDIDCGGSCARCPLGSTCASANDCLGSEPDAGIAGDAGVPGAQYPVPLTSCERGQCTTYAAIGTWEDRGPPGAKPAVSDSPEIAYDPVRKRVVLYGGFSPDTNTSIAELWLWNGTAWELSTVTPPGGRARGDAVWFAPRNAVVFANGITAESVSANTTTLWDGATFSNGGPGPLVPRQNASMVYDPVRQRIWTYGGSVLGDTQPFKPEMYGWDGTTWTEVDVSAANPGLRSFFDMAFDEKRGVAVLFGGMKNTFGNYDGETWLWDGTTWTNAMPAHPPLPRYNMSMTYDPVRERVVLLGGFLQGVSWTRRETFEWTGTDWVPSRSTMVDDSPETNRAVYDIERKRIFYLSANNQTVREYSLRGNACKNGSECASGSCVDGVCCGAPSCAPCHSCNQLSNPGVCTPVVNGPDKDSCTPPKTCNASSVCQ